MVLYYDHKTGNHPGDHVTRPSPVVAKFELAIRLRNQRRAINIPVSDIVKRFKFSRNYWSAVENERTLLSEDRLKEVLELLEFDPKEHDELLALHKLSLKKSWWDNPDIPQMGGTLPRFYGLEAGASQISLRLHLIPAILQTPNYSRAILANDPFVSEFERDHVLAVRAHRQEILFDSNPTELTVLFGEGVLRHQIGGRMVLREQLTRILAIANDDRSRVNIHIIPFTSPHGGVPGGTDVFLSFPSSHLPLVHVAEQAEYVAISDETQSVIKMKTIFDRNLQTALSNDDSLQFIHDVIQGL